MGGVVRLRAHHDKAVPPSRPASTTVMAQVPTLGVVHTIGMSVLMRMKAAMSISQSVLRRAHSDG